MNLSVGQPLISSWGETISEHFNHIIRMLKKSQHNNQSRYSDISSSSVLKTTKQNTKK
jgi:hypothetical protein